MQTTTSTRTAFIAIADRIANDIDTALTLPESAVRRGGINSPNFVYELPEANPLRHVDRSEWPETAAWLRNISAFIDAQPHMASMSEASRAIPEHVHDALTKMIVSDASVITWWTDDALNRENPFTSYIGGEFIYALKTLLTEQGPEPELQRIAQIIAARQQ